MFPPPAYVPLSETEVSAYPLLAYPNNEVLWELVHKYPKPSKTRTG